MRIIVPVIMIISFLMTKVALTYKNGVTLKNAGNCCSYRYFSLRRKVIYCILSVFFAKQKGILQFIQWEQFRAVKVVQAGKWLYTSHHLSNDGISIFNILSDSSLEKIGYTRTGRHPRNFMIADDGAYLFVACRDDKLIQIFEILPDGSLVLTGTSLTFEDDKPSSICGL